jgi:hypothetical protein
MSSFKTVAFLVPGHEYHEIFPDGEVPVQSVFPQIFEVDSEPCFLLDGSVLADWQVERFTEHVMRHWPNLYYDRNDAKDALKNGFPLLSSHVCGGRSDDMDAVLAALDEMLKDVVDVDDIEGDGGLDR